MARPKGTKSSGGLSNKTLLIQITGSTDKLDAAIKLFEKFNILEIIRSGKLLMSRGEAHT